MPVSLTDDFTGYVAIILTNGDEIKKTKNNSDLSAVLEHLVN
jgi:hypothetical protein